METREAQSKLKRFIDPQSMALVSIALILFILETGLIWTVPVPWLIGRVTADDFYYYLVLAKNSAAGLGPTFDGLTITNGFHPLYLLFLVPLAKLSPQEPAFLIRAALTWLLIFHNAGGLVIGFGFWRMNYREGGRLAALMWLLNPWTLAISLHGVEAPLAVFFWAMVIFNLYHIRRRRVSPSLRRGVILGVGAGLAILARTDGLLLLGAIMITELYRAWKSPAQRLNIVLDTLVVGLTGFLVTLPWWAWNWQNFRMLMQVSGKAIFLATHGPNWLNADLILSNVVETGQAYFSRLFFYSLLPLITLAFGLWKRGYLRQKPKPLFLLSLLRELDFVILAIAALALWYIGWQWNIQNWYLLSTILAITIIVGLILERLGVAIKANTREFVGFILFISLLFLVGVYSTTGFGFPRQERGYYLAQWLNQQAEPDSIVGAWNSGIIGYFSQNPVINLDGVVNNDLYDYKITHQTSDVAELMDYIKTRQITYLTDYELIYFANPPEMGLKDAYESPEYGFRVYQLIGD